MIGMWLGNLQAQPRALDGALPTPPLVLCTIDLTSLYQLMQKIGSQILKGEEEEEEEEGGLWCHLPFPSWCQGQTA